MNKRKTILVAGGLGLLAILVIALTGGGSQKSLRRAADSLLAAESLHAKTELKINLPPRLGKVDRPFTLISVLVEGDVQQADDATPELTGNLLLEARGRGNVFFADGETRILKDEVLFNLENLPVLLNPSGSLVKKWTRVETSLLKISNGEEVRQALTEVLANLANAGTEKVAGEKLTRFTGGLTAEQEERLFETLRQRSSGSPALHQIARLLSTNNVKSLDVWVVRGKKEIRRIAVQFVRPLSDGREIDLALLTFDFTDYGKEIAIDRPATALNARPEVFARVFGSGDLEEITLESP